MQALTDCGMAHILPHSPADPVWLHVAPDFALQAVLAGLQAQALRDQERILDCHQRLADAHTPTAQMGGCRNI